MTASDLLEESIRAAVEAAAHFGLGARDMTVLHRSNNVIVRVEDAVLKVGTNPGRIRREVKVAGDAARAGGPVVAPLARAFEVGQFAVSVWPYLRSDPTPAGDDVAARALHKLHQALATISVPLPALVNRLVEVGALLSDEVSTAALTGDGRACLLAAVGQVATRLQGAEMVVLHTEPHDGNRLTVDGAVVYLDLEAVCTGPLEWDLAHFPETVVDQLWPNHDRNLRQQLQLGVSASVSTYCWRHVTSRPLDSEIRWHAQHHLDQVRKFLG